MMRTIVLTLLILALCGVIVWITPGEAPLPLCPGQAYDVALVEGDATFDLPFASPNEHYLLIVSNLSRDPQSRHVTLTCEDIQQPELLPFRPAPALPTMAPAFGSAPPIETVSPSKAAKTSTKAPAHRREFWLYRGDGAIDNPARYQRIDASLAADGQDVRVYVDRDDEVAAETIEAIVAQFDHSVLPTTRRFLGSPADVDADGKFTILLTGWLARLDGGRVSLGGMVRPRDFQANLEAPFSNRADVLYLNANARSGRHLETLLAHELAHAVTASGRRRAGSLWFAETGEEAWLNEAISHVAENLQSDNWSNLDYRVSAYLASPETTPLVVANYAAQGMWRRDETRGSTYLFLRWLVDRYGVGLLPKLIHSPRRGVANVEACVGAPFDELYRQYALDLFLAPPPARPSPAARADVYDRVGDFPLAGPACEHWDVSESRPSSLQRLAGVATSWHVLAAALQGARRIHVRCEPGARLQVTLLRLSDVRPRLRLRAVSANGRRVELSLCGAAAIQVSHVIAQRIDDHGAVIDAPVCWPASELREVFTTDRLAPGERLLSRPGALPLFGGRLLIRVVGVGPGGERVAAQTVVECQTPAPHLTRSRRQRREEPAGRPGRDSRWPREPVICRTF